jgi:hypothetical protein
MFCPEHQNWLFRLETHHSWTSPYRLDRDWAFQDRDGITRLLLTKEGEIIVLAGYAWDGCTLKFFLLDVVCGTPDGVVSTKTRRPKTYFASLIHDALYQFLPLDGVPFDRRRADWCFMLLMNEERFVLRRLYHIAVRAFGWMTRPLTARMRQTTNGRRLDCSEWVAEIEGRPSS